MNIGSATGSTIKGGKGRAGMFGKPLELELWRPRTGSDCGIGVRVCTPFESVVRIIGVQLEEFQTCGAVVSVLLIVIVGSSIL
jgi:hypothetical protein